MSGAGEGFKHNHFAAIISCAYSKCREHYLFKYFLCVNVLRPWLHCWKFITADQPGGCGGSRDLSLALEPHCGWVMHDARAESRRLNSLARKGLQGQPVRDSCDGSVRRMRVLAWVGFALPCTLPGIVVLKHYSSMQSSRLSAFSSGDEWEPVFSLLWSK